MTSIGDDSLTRLSKCIKQYPGTRLYCCDGCYKLFVVSETMSLRFGIPDASLMFLHSMWQSSRIKSATYALSCLPLPPCWWCRILWTTMAIRNIPRSAAFMDNLEANIVRYKGRGSCFKSRIARQSSWTCLGPEMLKEMSLSQPSRIVSALFGLHGSQDWMRRSLNSGGSSSAINSTTSTGPGRRCCTGRAPCVPTVCCLPDNRSLQKVQAHALVLFVCLLVPFCVWACWPLFMYI